MTALRHCFRAPRTLVVRPPLLQLKRDDLTLCVHFLCSMCNGIKGKAWSLSQASAADLWPGLFARVVPQFLLMHRP